VALSYLLRATGPVTLPDGSALTASNAVDRLLSKVYLTQPDPDLQDLFFAGVARVIFRHAVDGSGDAEEMLEALTRAVEEGRLLVWSSRSEEQALLAETSLAGALPRESGPSPFVGVFLNDGTAAKMEYYLEHRVDVSSIACDGGGRQRLELRVTLTSRAPEDAAHAESVIGTQRPVIGLLPGRRASRCVTRRSVGRSRVREDGRFAPLDVISRTSGGHTDRRSRPADARARHRHSPAARWGRSLHRVTPGPTAASAVGRSVCDPPVAPRATSGGLAHKQCVPSRRAGVVSACKS
jgi:hypothetical protein